MLLQCNREFHCNILLSYCHFPPAHPRFFRTLTCPAAFAGGWGLSFSVSAAVAAAFAISESSALGLWIDRITSDTSKCAASASGSSRNSSAENIGHQHLIHFWGWIVRFNGHWWTQNHTRIWPDTGDERRWKHQKLNISLRLWLLSQLLPLAPDELDEAWAKFLCFSKKVIWNELSFFEDVGWWAVIFFEEANPEASSCLRDHSGSLMGAKFQKICPCSLRGFIPAHFFKLWNKHLMGKAKAKRPIRNETHDTLSLTSHSWTTCLYAFACSSLTSRSTQAHAIFALDFRIHRATVDHSVCDCYDMNQQWQSFRNWKTVFSVDPYHEPLTPYD